jgi:hypothetical protein
MVGGIVHDQNEFLVGIFGQDVFEKSDKAIGVFAPGGGIGDKACRPVVSAKDVQMLKRTSTGNRLALTPFHPAAAQGRMQAQGRFVHKEELGFGGTVEGDVFLSQSKISRTVS